MGNLTFPPRVDRLYSYFLRPSDGGKGWWVAATREEWLEAIALFRNSPKPPAYWITQQEEEGRSPKTSSIIWGRNYDAARKFVIWSEAPEEDFRAGGYLL